MRLDLKSLCSLALLLAGAATAPAQTAKGKATATPTPAALEVARMGFVEGGVEVRRPGGAWTRAAENQPLLMGDRVRTLRGGTARLEFPWTAIAVGDDSELALQDNRVLTLKLERGRLDIDPEQTLLRVVTEEAAISGSGRTLVRREGTSTFVGSYNGGAEVEGKGVTVRLGINKGTLTKAGSAPGEAQPLGPAPRVVSPSTDPPYVRPGDPVRLKWKGPEPAYHLEVLSIDSDVPVISLDIDAGEFELRLNWLGMFRWRVAGRTGPVESQPSGEGLICVVEK
jgi:hypothetical protein